MPSDEYFAGLFDGEGSISANRQGWKVCISMTNTYREVLELLQLRFGGKVKKVKWKNSNHFKEIKDRWYWRTQKASEMKGFLSAVYPYLIIKKNQAKIAFLILDKMNVQGARNPIPMIERKDLVEKLSNMNKRGCDENI